MKFNGAVLVDNNRINNAYNNYRKINEHYQEVFQSAKGKAITEVDTWSTFAKWWYKKPCHIFMWKMRYDVDGWTPLRRVLWEQEYIDKETHDWLERLDYGLRSDMNDLYAFVSCGEPVYLNAHQARLANEFYKGEEK